MSNTPKTNMLNAIAGYFTKVKANLKPIINERIILEAGATKVFKLSDRISDFSNYDPLSIRIDIYLLDKDASSSTVNNYIPRPANLTYVISPIGDITLYNNTTTVKEFVFYCSYPSVHA